MKLLELLNKKLNNKYSFLKILKVVYDTAFSICSINFIYPENVDSLSEKQKQEIYDSIVDILKLNGKLELKFNKSFLDSNLILKHIKSFSEVNYDSLNNYINEDNVHIEKNNLNVNINFSLNSTLLGYATDNCFSDNLKKDLNNNFCGIFNINLSLKEDSSLDVSLLEKRADELMDSFKPEQKAPRYNVENVMKVFGGEILPMPEYINNLKGEKLSLILAGTVEKLEEKEFIPRKNRENGSDEKRKMYKFKLNDGSGVVSCVHFCTKVSEKHFSLVEEGKQILCLGNFVKGYNNEMQYNIKSISLCTVQETYDCNNEEDKEEIKVNQGEYTYVKPFKYVKESQSNLFEEQVSYPEWITGSDWVVFDVETTGLMPDKNEITEIGAVKIKDGKIVECFQTLCKPHEMIIAEITKITGITNEMVENEHHPEEIISDFVTFCKGCKMVGYNVNFDYQFIQFCAQKVGLAFDNEFRDCMADAKNKLVSKNYRLGTIVDVLGLELSNAHRALFDATATAEVFLKLSLL